MLRCTSSSASRYSDLSHACCSYHRRDHLTGLQKAVTSYANPTAKSRTHLGRCQKAASSCFVLRTILLSCSTLHCPDNAVLSWSSVCKLSVLHLAPQSFQLSAINPRYSAFTSGIAEASKLWLLRTPFGPRRACGSAQNYPWRAYSTTWQSTHATGRRSPHTRAKGGFTVVAVRQQNC